MGDRESSDGNSFPGVKSLFGRGGFPGTIKLSRRAKSESTEQRTSAAGVQQGIAALGIGSMSQEVPPVAQHEPLVQVHQQHQQEQQPQPQVQHAVNSPGQQSSQSVQPPPPQQQPDGIQVSELRTMSTTRMVKFARLLDEQIVDLEALRELAWSGIPPSLRSICWRLLLGYLPPNRERRQGVLARRRSEYRNLLPEYYDRAAAAEPSAARSEEEEGALRQVAVDVPRTAPGVPFFHQPQIQKSLERILYIWGLRHPASGYVQGINDLVTPFMAVFISEHFPTSGPLEMEAWDASTLTADALLDVEADCYWCLCKLLDGIQDHYTYAQPGIQRTVFHMRELVGRVEAPVLEHLDREALEFIQFAFRWVNCLLLRELPFHLGVRLWDTYLAEGSQLKEFLVYVLAAFLLSWPDQLRTLEFQDLIMFLQRVPTGNWSEKDVELVLSRAYMWRASFKGATSHFNN